MRMSWAPLQEVRGEGMAERMTRDALSRPASWCKDFFPGTRVITTETQRSTEEDGDVFKRDPPSSSVLLRAPLYEFDAGDRQHW